MGNRPLFFLATRGGPICCSPECRDVGGRSLGLLAHACPGPGRGGWPGKAPLAFGVSPRAGSAFHVHPVLFMEEERFGGGGRRSGKLPLLEQATCKSGFWQAGALIFSSLNCGRWSLGRSQAGNMQEASQRHCEGRRGESPIREDSGPPFVLRCSSSTSAHTQAPLKPGEGSEPPLPPWCSGCQKPISVQNCLCRSCMAFIPLLLLLSLRSFGLEMQLLKGSLGASSASPGLK